MAYTLREKTALITGANRDIGKEMVDAFVEHGASNRALDAGMAEMAEPASLVANCIIQALEKEQFHAFPDTAAQQIGAVHQSSAEQIVEADLMAEQLPMQGSFLGTL